MSKGPFKYYVIKEVGGWGQKMAIFDGLQYCKSSEVGEWALKSQKHDDVILEWSLYYRVGNEIDFFFPLEWTATKTI